MAPTATAARTETARSRRRRMATAPARRPHIAEAAAKRAGALIHQFAAKLSPPRWPRAMLTIMAVNPASARTKKANDQRPGRVRGSSVGWSVMVAPGDSARYPSGSATQAAQWTQRSHLADRPPVRRVRRRNALHACLADGWTEGGAGAATSRVSVRTCFRVSMYMTASAMHAPIPISRPRQGGMGTGAEAPHPTRLPALTASASGPEPDIMAGLRAPTRHCHGPTTRRRGHTPLGTAANRCLAGSMGNLRVDKPIVVGFDGSEHARLALRWAVDEAARQRAPIAAVYAISWSPECAEVTSQETDRRVRERARRIADEAVAEAALLDPRVAITATVAAGHPVRVLCDLSREARTVVLGSRGHGGFAGLIAGSVSIAVATHAHCPVVVVRELPEEPSGLPVAVGVDDSPQSRLAVDVAFAEADARGVSVLAVRAWGASTASLHGTTAFLRSEELAEMEIAERRFLHDIIQPAAARHRQVRVEERLVDQTAAAALTEVAPKVQLLVVGSRGHGGFAGLLIGSVGMQLLHYARCPVAIVREAPAVPAGTP